MPQPRSRRVAHFFLLAVTLLGIAFGTSVVKAQSSETFKARLSPVPINEGMMSSVAGTGSLTATLTGKQLAIQGTFDGLKSSATTAQIHRSPKGIPGPAIAKRHRTTSHF